MVNKPTKDDIRLINRLALERPIEERYIYLGDALMLAERAIEERDVIVDSLGAYRRHVINECIAAISGIPKLSIRRWLRLKTHLETLLYKEVNDNVE